MVLVCQVVQKNALIGALKQASLCYRTEKLDQSSDTDLPLQHEGSSSSETRRCALATRNRSTCIKKMKLFIKSLGFLH